MRGLVLSGPDKTIEAQAKAHKLPVTVDAGSPFAYDKTLFVEPGTKVPWDLLPAAWHFLERWDAAVPLWRYGTNASEIGTPAERKQTAALVRDLRVPLHCWELVFARKNTDGQALIAAWKEECAGGGEKRLAFLRALYRVKPRCCVLPRSWLAEIGEHTASAAGRLTMRRSKAPGLIRVEISPGRFVQCRPEDEEKVREQFAKGRRGRG